MAKYQNKLGHNAKVIRRANYDPYSIYEFYKDLVEFVDETNYLDFCLKQAKNADIIHVHSRTDALLYLHDNAWSSTIVFNEGYIESEVNDPTIEGGLQDLAAS